MALSATNYTNKLLTLTYGIVVIVLFYRRPDAFYHAQFWAEEGTVFFKEAYEQGFSSLFNTCAGYYHLLPRFLACTSALLHLPLELVPFLFCYVWLAVLFLIVWYVWQRLPFNSLQKLFLSIVIVLIPLQSEVFMNQTNMQWVMVLFPVIIFSSPNEDQNNRWFYLDIVVLILAGLTGPNFTVLLPLFLFLLFSTKTNNRKKLLYVLAIIIGAIGLLALLNHGSVSRADGHFTLLNKGFVQYAFVQYAFLFIGKLAFKIPFLVMSLGVVSIIGLYVYALKQSLINYKQNKFLFICLITSLLFLGTTLIAYRNEPSLLSPYYRGVRNFYIPALLFVWALMQFLFTHKHAIKLLIALITLFSIELVLFVGTFKFEEFNVKPYSEKLYHSNSIAIPVNPNGWFIELNKPYYYKNK